jgi:hypothetical protein
MPPKMLQAPFMPSDIAEPATHPDRYTDIRDRLEQRQEDLRDAREALLGARFRLQLQRRELRGTRDKTAAQAGAAFHRIRLYLLQNNIDLPPEVQQLLSDADTSRDALGIKEMDYEEAENSYNLEEWKYTEKETQFIDHLPLVTPAPPAPFPHISNAESFRHFSHDPQEIAHLVAETVGENVLLSTVQTMLPVSYTKTYVGQHLLGVGGSSTLPESLPSFEGEVTGLMPPSDVTAGLSQPTTETLLNHTRPKWSETMRFIDEWLLRSLESSELEKARLRRLIPSLELSDKDQWKLVVRYWMSDSSNGLDVHTGDTTVSDENFSQAVSSNAMKRLFEESDTVDSDTKATPAMPLLAHEQIVSAPDLADYPENIQPRDLVEKPPKHVTFLVRSSSTYSESTQHTNMTRTSSRQDCSSISTIDEGWSSTSSCDGRTVRSGKEAVEYGLQARLDAGKVTQATPCFNYGQSESERQGEMLLTAGCPRLSPANIVQLDTLRPPGDHPPLEDNEVSPLPESEPDDLSMTESAKPQDHSLLPKIIHVEPASPFQSGSYYPDAHIPPGFFVEPYIRVKSPRPWSLPLLRLTALPTPPHHSSPPIDSSHRLKDVPFVTLPDTPLRLPGPSKCSEVFLPPPYERQCDTANTMS